MTNWLTSNGLDTAETVNIFSQNRIYLENMHHLQEQDLLKMGITEWGSRISIMDAIHKYMVQQKEQQDPQALWAQALQTNVLQALQAQAQVQAQVQAQAQAQAQAQV
eukprot:TRINITY_DN3487_c0_g1_i6.p2 TRINITY_DN3487_c0_g1~~TRINITY_DN3487_c0_g1_i6.p2  ORF type:complete len:107 (+),score=22.14 TRINITY_DN3487_c0_g1_i6:528-848(+)